MLLLLATLVTLKEVLLSSVPVMTPVAYETTWTHGGWQVVEVRDPGPLRELPQEPVVYVEPEAPVTGATLRVRLFDVMDYPDTLWSEYVGAFLLPADSAGFDAMYAYRIRDHSWRDAYSDSGQYVVPPLRWSHSRGTPYAEFAGLAPGEYYIMSCSTRPLKMPWRKLSPNHVQPPDYIWELNHRPAAAWVDVLSDTTVNVTWTNWTNVDPVRDGGPLVVMCWPWLACGSPFRPTVCESLAVAECDSTQ